MEEIFKNDEKYLLNVYKRLPIIIKKAKGIYIYDQFNNAYLDMFSGIAVNAIGYNNKKINKAIIKQIKKHLHVSNYFINVKAIKLAEVLINHSCTSKCFYTNSGTEANEAAIKVARAYGKQISNDKVEIITLTDSFHGRTCGGLSLTGQIDKKEKFLPLIDKVIHVKRNDINSLRENVSNKTCAIFLELIQGESGINLLTQDFIEEVKLLSKKYNFIIIIDEIQSGLMRTGSLFSYYQFNINPDIITLAKSLGGGLPLGAMLVNERLEKVLSYGDHGSTFGGNPVACASGYAMVEMLLKPKLQNQIVINSKYLYEKLTLLKEKYAKIIKEIRGMGMMIGLDVGQYANIIKEKAFNEFILLNVTSKTIIRLLPPLIINKKQIDHFINKLEKVLKEIEE